MPRKKVKVEPFVGTDVDNDDRNGNGVYDGINESNNGNESTTALTAPKSKEQFRKEE